MSSATETSDTDDFAEIIDPSLDSMPPAVAQYLLTLALTKTQKEQMRTLADKNKRGTLTAAERSLVEGYRRVGSYLNLVQAKARLFLKHYSSSQEQSS